MFSKAYPRKKKKKDLHGLKMVIFVKPVELDCMEYCGPNRQEDAVLYCLKILMRAISGHKLL